MAPFARAEYETTGSRDLVDADKRLKPFRRFFTGWRAAQIDGDAFNRYVAHRRTARPTNGRRRIRPVANGTLNRERSVLLTLLRLAHERGKLARVPKIASLKEAPPRQGFFEAPQYAAVRRHLTPDLQTACDIAYVFGWRMQSEVLTLEWRQVDFAGGRLILDAGSTKNDEAREVFLTPALKAALTAQRERVDALQRQLGRIIAAVFPHLEGRHQGVPRRDFRRSWLTRADWRAWPDGSGMT